jgi:Tat protein secretion system quality control protein TatD with DNase activity
VIKKLAEIKNVSEEEIAEITTVNAERIFGIP